MTMNYERRNAVNRTRELLVDLLWEKFPEVQRDSALWEEVRRCLKHFPTEYDMEIAAEESPNTFGD